MGSVHLLTYVCKPGEWVKTPVGFPSFSPAFLFCCLVEGGRALLLFWSQLVSHSHAKKTFALCNSYNVIALCSLTGSSLGRKPPERFLNIAGGPCQNEGTQSEFTVIHTGRIMLLQRCWVQSWCHSDFQAVTGVGDVPHAAPRLDSCLLPVPLQSQTILSTQCTNREIFWVYFSPILLPWLLFPLLWLSCSSVIFFCSRSSSPLTYLLAYSGVLMAL